MQIIDVSKWKRKAQFENFIRYTDPIFSIGVQLDVTELVGKCKREELSFFASFLYIAISSINEVEELRLRLLGNDVVLFDNPTPDYIVMNGNDNIITCSTPLSDSFKDFHARVRADIEAARGTEKEKFNDEKLNDCVYVSCLPWISVTSFKNPYNIADREQSSIPRVTWGRFDKDASGRYIMGFDIAAHHALCDGQHVASAIIKIKEALNNVDKYLGG